MFLKIRSLVQKGKLKGPKYLWTLKIGEMFFWVLDAGRVWASPLGTYISKYLFDNTVDILQIGNPKQLVRTVKF